MDWGLDGDGSGVERVPVVGPVVGDNAVLGEGWLLLRVDRCPEAGGLAVLAAEVGLDWD